MVFAALTAVVVPYRAIAFRKGGGGGSEKAPVRRAPGLW